MRNHGVRGGGSGEQVTEDGEQSSGSQVPEAPRCEGRSVGAGPRHTWVCILGGAVLLSG